MVARVIGPQSKLAPSRALNDETKTSTLGELLGVQDADQDALYSAMDWLLPRQGAIEAELARRHLCDGTFVLYDVSSTYFEGHSCPLAKLGHSRDGKKDKLQIVFGLLCSADGCPVAVEVFEGNTGDPRTFTAQVDKVRTRFGLQRVVFVGDRGMITDARIRDDLRGVEGLDWITALRAPAIQKLVEDKVLQLSIFDTRDLAEITSPSFPGERLVVCKNPLLAEERARKQRELLDATEKQLRTVVAATERAKRPLRGRDRIGMRVGKVVGHFKMAKHFTIEITDDKLCIERNERQIAEEAALDGIYVIRTSVPPDMLDAERTVKTYKGLSVVERAFRSCKTVDLKVRPIHHHLEGHVRAHVFLCMLAYYVEWHMRRALAPILFDDDDKPAADARRTSIVAPAQRSPSALSKANTKRTQSGEPVHSFQSLLADLATIANNRIQPTLEGVPEFDRLTKPTPPQRRALHLLGVSLDCAQ